MDSLADYALYCHIFDNVFKGEIKRNAVFVVVDQFCLFLKQATLLQNEFFIKSDGFDILLQNGNQLQIFISINLRVLRYSFSVFIFLIAALF